jgi:hypothetical protein
MERTMKGLVFTGLCLFSLAALAADKPPNVTPFAKLQVLADKTVVDIQGTWGATALEGRYAKATYDPGPINTVYIVCYAKEKSCYEALSWVDNNGYLRQLIIPYDLLRWEVTEVKAESKNLCETLELNILAGTKEVTKTIRTGGLTPQRGCPNRAPDKRLSSPVVLLLMEPNDAAVNAIMRKNK